jgi:hypothetical protein
MGSPPASSPREEQPTLDYFPSGATRAPLFVFIHGGYWQRNEKERFSFVVPGPRSRGINVAVPGYTLAPVIAERAFTTIGATFYQLALRHPQRFLEGAYKQYSTRTDT